MPLPAVQPSPRFEEAAFPIPAEVAEWAIGIRVAS